MQRQRLRQTCATCRRTSCYRTVCSFVLTSNSSPWCQGLAPWPECVSKLPLMTITCCRKQWVWPVRPASTKDILQLHVQLAAPPSRLTFLWRGHGWWCQRRKEQKWDLWKLRNEKMMLCCMFCCLLASHVLAALLSGPVSSKGSIKPPPLLFLSGGLLMTDQKWPKKQVNEVFTRFINVNTSHYN